MATKKPVLNYCTKCEPERYDSEYDALLAFQREAGLDIRYVTGGYCKRHGRRLRAVSKMIAESEQQERADAKEAKE